MKWPRILQPRPARRLASTERSSGAASVVRPSGPEARATAHPFADPASAHLVTLKPDAPAEEERPTELLGFEALEQHARAMALRHRTGPRPRLERLLPRLAANEAVINRFHQDTAGGSAGTSLTPAAEWLWDNFYLIKEQIRLVRRHLPRGFSRELPHLTNGPCAHYPRVYELALQLVAHVDGRVDGEHLSRFVAPYQEVASLRLGELWAVPIMLRLALIENLRRLTLAVETAGRDRVRADRWAERILDVAENDPSRLIVVVGKMMESEPHLSPAFIAEFWRRTQGRNPGVAPVSGWLETRLGREGPGIEQLIQTETQAQAAMQVSVGNSITSLRQLQALDWREFVEQHSVVEQVLRSDPAETYPAMDFATRDQYRHAVERLARHGSLTESEVAHHAISLAYDTVGPEGDRRRHVGYFLVDAGLAELEERVQYRPPVLEAVGRRLRAHALAVYLAGVGTVTVLTLLAGKEFLNRPEISTGVLAGVLVLLALAGSQLGVALVNWLSTLLVRPVSLPRLDFSRGIPADHRTLVVVPSLLTTAAGIEELLENLEIHYLANRDENVYFGLLTDFADAAESHLPTDPVLLRQAREGVEALNVGYPSPGAARFFLFHRERTWNEQEQVWMGYERKRGKLRQLNRCLRGASPDGLQVLVGDLRALPRIQYVITLDADTQLPRDAARILAGSLGHPLNRPVYDAKCGRVTAGYGILQPRVVVSLPNASRSIFARLFAGEPGLDPYTRTVSDVYQDLFREGSFIGKGIYDVDAFEQALDDRFPDNRILSHDLIEGSYARSGLVTDVLLFEGFPARYTADTRRRHRWIRGDWQIATWLLPRVPGPDVRRLANPINALSRWKIFDNLRRSLVPAALLGLLILGWMSPAVESYGWTGFIVLLVLLPSCLSAVSSLLSKPDDVPMRAHFAHLSRSLSAQLSQALLTLVFLPFDACVSLDAMLRTLGRLWVTRRHLLEWQTMGDTERENPGGLTSYYATMISAPLVAVAVGLGLGLLQAEGASASIPFLCAWCIAPWVGWRISQPLGDRSPALLRDQQRFLRRVARRTWSYFEIHATARDHWLPPDNFQEFPQPVTATRTSPTNIGMGLISTLAAWDFGYVSTGELMRRISACLLSLSGLERHQGHFFNWYDTRTLQPLPPLYLSTVDNGNLAGLLLVLRSGLMEIAARPGSPPQVFAGLLDTVQVLREVEQDSAEPVPSSSASWEVWLTQAPDDWAERMDLLEQILGAVKEVPAAEGDDSKGESVFWRERLEQQCRDHLADLGEMFPWLSLRQRFTEVTAPALRSTWERLIQADTAPSAEQLKEVEGLSDFASDWTAGDQELLGELRNRLAQARNAQTARVQQLEELVRQCDVLAALDFTLLYDCHRELFSIGYNVTHHRLDSSCYDLLASESRLTSLVGIAFGQIPQDHWFALGRQLTSVGGQPTLISWSGSMFEYLMPALVMPSYEQTLLDTSCRAAVRRQMDYARQLGLPWGVSESGYNLTDAQANYQYRAFGVPGLGYQRGLAEDQVITPYASAMALLFEPVASVKNLRRLQERGVLGRHGFYEALDFTPARRPPGKPFDLVRSYMAHHQGMSLLGFAGVLLDQPMQRRFQANPLFKAVELLLQERIPRETSYVYPHELAAKGPVPEAEAARHQQFHVFRRPTGPHPEVHLLSNGRYHVMVTTAGGGYSRWNDLLLTRWREDPTRDGWGTFIYFRDRQRGEIWSAAHQPMRTAGECYEAIFSQGRAEFRDRHGDIEHYLEISVSPEDDVEVRRVTLTNHSSRPRMIEITTYTEVVLTTPAADVAHPAFGKLFVQTQIVRSHQAVICSRRPRAPDEQPPRMFQMLLAGPGHHPPPTFETCRARFMGRHRPADSPAALQPNVQDLAGTEGPVLDPVVAIRRVILVPPRGETTVTLVMGCAPTDEAVRGLVEKYHDQAIADRAFDLAWTHGLVTLRHLNITSGQARVFESVAGAVLYAHSRWRASDALVARNTRGQRNLWSLGISGDLPLVLVRASGRDQLELVRAVLQMHAFWRLKGLAVDLIIVNEDESTYRQDIHDQIMALVGTGMGAQLLDRPGGIFVRPKGQIPPEEFVLLQAAARAIFSDDLGSLANQVDRRMSRPPLLPLLVPSRRRSPRADDRVLSQRDLIFDNGTGGFTRDGREYVITLRPENETPAPWVNVIANPGFGTVVSEAGPSYTWSENCHEFRLTPWTNDPVSDPSGEAFYLRDEETGRFWSPTPRPARGQTPYVIRHGLGYSVFEHAEEGIDSELWMYVSLELPVKFVRIGLRNTSRRDRTLTVWGYWEWVLGEHRHREVLHHITEYDASSEALLVHNHYHSDFSGRVVFAGASEAPLSYTGDRREFIGRHGDLSNPDALSRTRLSNRLGARLDSCAALQVRVDLPAGSEKELIFVIGVGESHEQARERIQQARSPAGARSTLEAVWAHWNRVLDAVQVETPDPAVDVLFNGWLPYQILACRLWARSGFYQSGGAFGFRDQLQDAMALVHCRPELLREQVLRAAAHQFLEGDVQHWWHPPSQRGVRTHFSDDFLWLPLAVCRYVEVTGDFNVLEEQIPYLEGRPLHPEEEAYYDLPQVSAETGSLYDHCVRALRRGWRFGERGLPLMGGGDWNDGMNLVGHQGRGESVWLAFFLFEVLNQFTLLAERQGDEAFAHSCREIAGQLRQATEANAWDGRWYRRAYFDDGQPLGSASNTECQIDALPQAWAVLSGLAEPGRQQTALASVAYRLVDREAGLIRLFDPPFDAGPLQPGYIKGYLPGVRENGGQYTHAAVWSIMAFAQLGDTNLAWELFDLINPVHHGDTARAIERYRVEPYVMAADVYSLEPHTGRGGWTWYTGSAGWMYRLILETLLGVCRVGQQIHFKSRLRPTWPSVRVRYQYRSAFYHITLINLSANGPTTNKVILDGVEQAGPVLDLADDQQTHHVEVHLARES